MTKIWVIGSNGQLGNELQILAKKYKDYKFIFSDLPDTNICDKKNLEKKFAEITPDVLINAAAYTNVDKAESEYEEAYKANSIALKYLAELCQLYGTFLLHISTDFVFDGKQSTPYLEKDLCHSASVYGQTKHKGEMNIIFNSNHACIIRTAWLYGNFGKNFMKTILEKGSNGKHLDVVFDQVGTPTWSADLAKVCMQVVVNRFNITGVVIFHYTNEGVASWYDFAYEILSIAGEKPNIKPITTKEMPRPAPRPAYSVLDKTKIKNFLEIEIPYWKDSLKKCISLSKK